MSLKNALTHPVVLALAAVPTVLGQRNESIAATCSSVTLSTDLRVLEAVCSNKDNRPVSSTLNLDHCLGYQDGRLRFVKEGKWSATDCYLSKINCVSYTDNAPPTDQGYPKVVGTTLWTAMQSSEDHYVITGVDLSAGIVNEDGYLTCFGIHDGQ